MASTQVPSMQVLRDGIQKKQDSIKRKLETLGRESWMDASLAASAACDSSATSTASICEAGHVPNTHHDEASPSRTSPSPDSRPTSPSLALKRTHDVAFDSKPGERHKRAKLALITHLVHARERGDRALSQALRRRAAACTDKHSYQGITIGYAPMVPGGNCRICMRGPPCDSWLGPTVQMASV